MPNGAKVINDDKTVYLQFLAHQGPTDNPGIVGQLDNISIHWPSNCNCRRAGKWCAIDPFKFLPRRLKTRMFRCFQCHGLAKCKHAAVLNLS